MQRLNSASKSFLIYEDVNDRRSCAKAEAKRKHEKSS